MAVGFVSAGNSAAGTANITVPLPAGLQADDLLLLLCESANQPVATPSGWQVAPSSPQGVGTAAGTAATRLDVFYRWVDGTQTNTTIADPGNHAIARMVAYRGVDPVNPFNASAGSTKATASTTVTFPSVTTTKDNCLVLLMEAHSLPDANSTAVTSNQAMASLESITERLDNNTNAGNGGGFSLAEGLKATAGSTGTGSATLSASAVGAHITLALTPFVELQQLTLTADAATVDAVAQDAGLSRAFPALVADPAALTLAGQPAALFKGVTLTAEVGAFAASDEDATLRVARNLKGDQVDLTVGGQPATLTATRILRADAASFTLTGVVVNTTKAYRLTAAPASYAYVGNDAGVGKGLKIAAGPAAFAAAGQDAEWVLDLNEPPQMPEVNGAELLWYEILGEPIPALTLEAELGQFDLIGHDAKVLYGRTVSAPAQGVFTAAGQDNAFRRTYSLKADVAAFTEVGLDANLRTARRLVSDPVAFSHAGQPAGVLYGRVVGAAQASFTVASTAMNFRFQRFLRPILANLVLAGEAATLFKSLMFRADGGRVDLNLYSEALEPGASTADAKLLRQYKTTAVPAGFTLAFFDATFRKTKLFVADGASFSLTGLAANTRTARRLTAATVGLDLQPYDIGFSWQHVMRPLPVTFDVGGIDAALKKLVTLYADGVAYALEGYSSRPFFSSLPQARDYVVRPMELRGITRPAEVRTTVRPAETTTSARPAEDRYAEHE